VEDSFEVLASIGFPEQVLYFPRISTDHQQHLDYRATDEDGNFRPEF
jgi:hypothetical protein